MSENAEEKNKSTKKQVEENKKVSTKEKVGKNKNVSNKKEDVIEKQKQKNLKPVKVKKVKETLTLKEKKELEIIEKEKKSQEILSKGKMTSIYKSVVKNILYAIIVMLYSILLITGCNLLASNIFIILLKVLSIVSILVTIGIFEIAYKKDSGKLTVTGIEFLVLSICTLVSIRIYTIFNNKFVGSVTSVSLLYSIYYVYKAIRVYIKEKVCLCKEENDINGID